MIPIRIAVVAVAITLGIYSTPGFPQASLVLKNFDGQTVGWLLSKYPDTHKYQYLTPDGFILTLDWRGWVTTSTSVTPDKLLYVESECAGQTYVQQDFLRISEIYQLGGDATSNVFVAQSFNATGSFSIDVVSEKDKEGACNPVSLYTTSGRYIQEIDPVTYGLSPFLDHWVVKVPNYIVERPEIISCDSFESCPP